LPDHILTAEELQCLAPPTLHMPLFLVYRLSLTPHCDPDNDQITGGKDDYSWPKIVHIIQRSGLLSLDDQKATLCVFCTSLVIYLSCRTKFCYELHLNTGCLRFHLQQFYTSYCCSCLENNLISLVDIENDFLQLT
jgi:hypothetical protein